MALTNAGRDFIAEAVMNDTSPTFFDNTNAYIGVGNGTGVFGATQTDLQGASKFRQGMEATYPTRAANALTFRSLVGTADANYRWEEWAVFNAAAAGDMLNRKVEYLGEKTSFQSWQITVVLTINAA